MNLTPDMLIIKPHVMTDAMLTSSTALETAPAAYAGGTTYALDAKASVAGAAGLITVYRSKAGSNTGHTPASSPTWWEVFCTLYQAYAGGTTYAADDRVQDNTAHMIYQSVQAANTGHPLTDTDWWIPVSANNVWAPFDDEIGTSIECLSPLAIVMRPGSTSGLAIFDADARIAQVVMKDAPGGTTVFTREVDLDATIVESFFDWFMSDFEQLTDVVLTDLPAQFANCELTVTFTGGGMVGVGVLKPGKVIGIGKTKMGAKVGIVSYTKKVRNDFGNLSIVRRTNSKKNTLAVVTDAKRFNAIYQILAALDGVLCVFIGTQRVGFLPLLVYGFYVDFSIDVEYSQTHLCALEIEGVI